jgi:hypothetical protein
MVDVTADARSRPVTEARAGVTRFRDADWDDPLAPGPDPAVHGWRELAAQGTRALTEEERGTLRGTYTRNVALAAVLSVFALAMLAVTVSYFARGFFTTGLADLVITSVGAYAAWAYYSRAVPAREDLRHGHLDVLEAPMVLRSDGAPARVVEVESGGYRSRGETLDVTGTLTVEVLPVSRRVWTVAGRRVL